MPSFTGAVTKIGASVKSSRAEDAAGEQTFINVSLAVEWDPELFDLLRKKYSGAAVAVDLELAQTDIDDPPPAP